MLALLPRRASVTVWPPQPLAQARLNQCLTLAVLAHLLLMLMFGTAPGGTAKPGEGVWGTLNVTLRNISGGARVETGATPPAEIPVTPKTVETGPPGKAAQQRFGGAVRSEPAPAVEQPGAAQLGRWNEAPAPTLNDPVETPAPEPTRVLPTQPDSGIERLQRPAPLSSAAPARTPETVQSLPAQRTVTAPEPPTKTMPTAPTSGVERVQKAAPLSPAAPSRAVEALSTVPAARTIEAPPQPEPVLQTLQTPAVTSLTPLTPVQAPRVTPLSTPAPTSALTPGVPDLPPAPSAEAPRGQPQATSTRPAVTPSVGAPDAGQRLGHDVATAPSAPASAPRAPLDLRLPKGGELARRGSTGVFNMMPAPPEKKDKLAESLEKTARGDCRNEHAGGGLLAAIPLAVDTVRGKGCKW